MWISIQMYYYVFIIMIIFTLISPGLYSTFSNYVICFFAPSLLLAPCSFSWSLGWQHDLRPASLIAQHCTSCLFLQTGRAPIDGDTGCLLVPLVPASTTTALADAEQRRQSAYARGSQRSDQYASRTWHISGGGAYIIHSLTCGVSRRWPVSVSCTQCMWPYLIRLEVSYHFQLYYTCWFNNPYCRILCIAR